MFEFVIHVCPAMGSTHVHPSIVPWVGVAALSPCLRTRVDYDDSWLAGKAGVMPETSFLRLRWR